MSGFWKDWRLLPPGVLFAVGLMWVLLWERAAPISFRVSEIRVSSESERDDTVTAIAILDNRSEADVTIVSAESSSCSVRARVAGVVVPARGSAPVPFDVGVPSAGIHESRVAVHYAGGSDPVLLRVRAIGRGALPEIRTVRPRHVSFSSLGSVLAGYDDVIVETREAPGSVPCIRQVLSGVTHARVDRIAVGERVGAGVNYVERTYRYRVGWRSLPLQPCAGDLVAELNSGVSIPLGRVSAGDVLGSLLSPSVVHLSLRERSEQHVLLAPEAGTWGFGLNASFPEWLDVQWTSQVGEHGLAFRIADGYEPPAQRLSVPLTTDKGVVTSIALVIEP